MEKSRARRFPQAMQDALQALQTAYALVNAAGGIIEHDENFPLYLGEKAPLVGRNLVDILPELAGDEEKPEEVQSEESPFRQVKYVNRTMPTGETRYLTITMIHGRPDKDWAWMVLLSDVTEYAIHFQQLIQNRNELLLLQGQLKEVALRLWQFLGKRFPPTR